MRIAHSSFRRRLFFKNTASQQQHLQRQTDSQTYRKTKKQD
jgi:hypothetical protein